MNAPHPITTPRTAHQDEWRDSLPLFSVWLLECRYADGQVYISRPFTHNAGASKSEAMARAYELEPYARHWNGAFSPNATVTLIGDNLTHDDALLVMDEEPSFRDRNWGGFAA